MSRSSSPMLLVAVLSVGMVLGMALDRAGRPLSAQATGAGAADAPPAVKAEIPRGRAVGEDAIYGELARQYDQFQPINRTFELVARAVSPAVAHIVAHKVDRSRDDEKAPARFEESGSGVIVRLPQADGLFVLTNHHVVDGAESPEVDIVLHDGRVLHPRRTWSDPKADIAVLGLGRDDLPAARLGDSDEAAVGTWVLALGSPFGLTHSVSQGIISARGRHEDVLLEEDGVENQDFLQTDAAINPGNSGGPLVNMKGEVIGINTAIASNGGGSEGVGFSIPINLARWIMAQLVVSGKVSRGAMGVDLFPDGLRHENAVALGLERPRGAWVQAVRQPSPAAEAGVRDGDVILRYNGIEVANLNHLMNLVAMTDIGKVAEVVVWRDRREYIMNVRIADQAQLAVASAAPAFPAPSEDRAASDGRLRRAPRPPEPSATDPSAAERYQIEGLELVTLDGSPAARRLGFGASVRGVAVTKVEPTSPFAGYFKPLDVLHSIDGQPIRTAAEAARALARRTNRAPMELGIRRMLNGTLQRYTLRFPR